VWAAPNTHLDLPVVSPAGAEAIFMADLKRDGLPRNLLLFGRDLIALNSMGDAAFAVAQLTQLPPAMHATGWYWEAARLICFQYPPAPVDLRTKLRDEADTIGDPSLDFRAYDEDARGHPDGVRELLADKPDLSDVEATLLLRVEATGKQPDALALARRRSLFDLTNGEHWQTLAELEEQAGNVPAAADAWRKLLYYAPDRDNAAAFDFFNKHPDQPFGPGFLLGDRFSPPPVNPAAEK
jgi:tetratricopeptide (TPR) repeat protein